MRRDFIVDQGCNFSIDLDVRDEDGNEIEGTMEGKARLDYNVAAGEVEFVFTDTKATLSPAVTATMKADRHYVYDITLTYTLDDEETKVRILEGLLTVTPGVG
jgi:hypothetical protein